MQIAKGLHRIGSDIVNSYLVVGADGVTIIDAGLPRYWSQLTASSRGWADPRRRAGADPHARRHRPHRLRDRLSRETGIPAYLHPADDDRAQLE